MDRMKRRLPFPSVLLIILAAVVALDCIWQSSREIVLQGFFTNDEENNFPAGEIAKDYGKYLGLGRREKISLDDTLWLEPGSSYRENITSESKIVAYTASRELDFVVTTPANIDHWRSGMEMADMEELFPGLPPSSYLRAADGTGTEKAVALDLAGCRYLPAEKRGQFYLFVPATSERKEAAVAFLSWLFQI